MTADTLVYLTARDQARLDRLQVALDACQVERARLRATMDRLTRRLTRRAQRARRAAFTTGGAS
jgi:hypothetical protein